MHVETCSRNAHVINGLFNAHTTTTIQQVPLLNIEEALVHCDNFSQLFFTICEKLDDDQRSNLCMVLWSIWRKGMIVSRTTMMWTSRRVVYRAEKKLHIWKRAKKSKNKMQVQAHILALTIRGNS